MYTAPADDHIEREPFWADYTRRAKLRNDIVHCGASADADTVWRYLAAASPT